MKFLTPQWRLLLKTGHERSFVVRGRGGVGLFIFSKRFRSFIVSEIRLFSHF
jgi:hypothetical protein